MIKKNRTGEPSLDLPEFETIEEERQWWDTHHDAINRFIARASQAGAFNVGPVVARGPEPTTQTTIRLLSRDVQRAKEIAAKKGIRYQSLLKLLLHDALDREAEKAS